MHLPWHLRSFIAQLRTGTLPLHIETGRYRHVKPEKTFCFICNEKDSVENKLHFLFDCSAYTVIRLGFYNYENGSIANFMQIPYCERLKLMLTDKRLLHKSALYIQDCYRKRSDILYKNNI